MSAVAHISEYKTGRFYSDEYRGDMSWNGYENNVLLRNEGCIPGAAPRFVDVAMAVGADDVLDSRGVAFFDYDNDGDLDLAINHNPGDNDRVTVPASLLRNDVGQRRNWLAVELVGNPGRAGGGSNRDAVGALVIAESGDLQQMRLREAGSGYASQHSGRLYFGLGEHEQVDRLTVKWPSGAVDVFESSAVEGLTAGALLRVTEGVGLEALSLPSLQAVADAQLGGDETTEAGP